MAGAWQSLLTNLHIPSAIAGAGLAGVGWALRAWIEARKERDKEALAASRALRELIPLWAAGVRQVVAKGKSFDEVKADLEAFREGGQFEPKLEIRIATLKRAPECLDAVAAANRFKNDILNVKHYLEDTLRTGGAVFFSDFSQHRDEALRRLNTPLEQCREEFDSAIAVLERKRDKIFPWLDRIFPVVRRQRQA
jgi:hypothetical protein